MDVLNILKVSPTLVLSLEKLCTLDIVGVSFEPPLNKTNELCVPSEDRSASASAQSDQPLHCALNRKLKTQGFFMRTAKTDQTGQMPRLI